jgi:hypothetical protein
MRFCFRSGPVARAVLAVLFVAALSLTAAPAGAQVFGQFVPAGPRPDNASMLGAYLLLGDRADDVGLLGQWRMQPSAKFGWGLQFGFADGSGDGSVLIGGDVMPQIRAATSDFPLDLAFNGAIGLSISDAATLFEFQPALLFSHRFPLSGSSGSIAPYGSVGIDIEHVSFDSPGNNDDDTDVDVIARFGAEWMATSKFGIIGEFGVGNGTVFNTGVNVSF